MSFPGQTGPAPMAVLTRPMAVLSCQCQNTKKFSRSRIFGFGARMASFTISRVTNLSTAEPPADLKFRKETKGNLVICLSQRLSKAGVERSRARIAHFTMSPVKNLSTAGPCTNLRFREETKGNLSHKWLRAVSQMAARFKPRIANSI